MAKNCNAPHISVIAHNIIISIYWAGVWEGSVISVYLVLPKTCSVKSIKCLKPLIGLCGITLQRKAA